MALSIREVVILHYHFIPMKTIKMLAICNLIAFIIQLTFSQLTQFKLIGNKSVGQVSNEYPSVFAPAGITFAIWGIIYLSLLGFCIFHLLMAYKKNENYPANIIISKIAWLFILNNLATTAWLYFWVNEKIWLCVALIIFQLITLVSIHIRLGIYNSNTTANIKIFTQFPLCIYFGWIAIATIANVSAALVSSSWDGFGLSAIFWTNSMISMATLITVFMVIGRKNIGFGLVVLWAIFGIVLKRKQIDASIYQDVILTAWVAFGIVAASIILNIIRRIKTNN